MTVFIEFLKFCLTIVCPIALFQVAVFFGGLPISKDEQVLKSNCPHIVVGTPGRILALVRSKKLNLKNLKHFILDECDKMLEQLGEFCCVFVRFAGWIKAVSFYFQTCAATSKRSSAQRRTRSRS